MRYLLALLFLVLALAKLLDTGPFETFVEAQLEMGRSAARFVAWVVIAVEVGIAISLLLSGPRMRRVAALASLTIAVGGISFALLSPELPCGCFGAFMKATALRRVIVGGAIGYLATTLLLAESAAPISAS